MRTVISLYYLRDMPIREISEVLDVSEGAVKTRLHRARRILMDLLQNRGERKVTFLSMSPSEIEKQNQELNRKLQSEKVNLDADTVMIPDLVRERLDAFYTQMESDVEPLSKSPSLYRPGKKFLRETAIVAASAAVISVMIIGSAFVSPTMAESLKQVPL